MEINRALNIIYAKYGKFENLPDHMSINISKNDFLSYLQNENEINHKAIETFLNLIFDEVLLLSSLSLIRMKKIENPFLG